VLAGGGSTRFAGGDKALATVGGEPIVTRVAAALRRATGRAPVVAVRSKGQRRSYRAVLPPDVEFVRDAAGFAGPLAGVVGAAGATTRPRLFVCACDMPLVSSAAVRWLLSRLDDEGADAVAVRLPDGTVEPLHAAYRRAAVLAARDRLAPDDGPRALVDALDARTVRLDDAPPDVPLSTSLSNVNTRADLAAARERLAGSE